MRLLVSAPLFCLLALAAPAAAQSPAGDPCREDIATTALSFDLYRGALTAEGEATVDRLAAMLRACPSRRFELQVHTDTVRTQGFNRRASQQVAQAVRARLVRHGIDPTRLAACGYGESMPLARDPSWRGSRNERLVIKRIDDAAHHRCPS